MRVYVLYQRTADIVGGGFLAAGGLGADDLGGLFRRGERRFQTLGGVRFAEFRQQLGRKVHGNRRAVQILGQQQGDAR